MNNNYYLSDDKSLLNIDVVFKFLTNCYWSKGVPLTTLKKAIENSLCFGVYTAEHQQIGFARMITDKATFAYLADVFILPEHRGQGLSKKLITFIKEHDELQGLRRVVLATADAHQLYQQFDFTPLHNPEYFMEVWQPGVYQKNID